MSPRVRIVAALLALFVSAVCLVAGSTTGNARTGAVEPDAHAQRPF